MATGFQERIGGVLKCGICHEQINQPKCLPCIHTFCKNCIDNLFQNRPYRTNEARCPICRRKFVLDHSGASGLMDNFLYKDILSAYHEREAELNNRENGTHCEKCERQATTKCLHCPCVMCETCLHIHNSIPGSSKHKIIKLSELSGIDNNIILRVEHLSSHCHTHGLLPTRYCDNCDKVICAECYQENHKTHKTENVTAIKKVKEHIGSTARKIKSLNRELKSELEKCKENISYLEKDSNKTSDEITAWFNEIRDMVNAEESKMKQTLERHLKTELSKEEERKTEIENAISSTQNLSEHIETVSRIATDIFLVFEKSVIDSWAEFLEDDKKKLDLQPYRNVLNLVTNVKDVTQAIAKSAKLDMESACGSTNDHHNVKEDIYNTLEEVKSEGAPVFLANQDDFSPTSLPYQNICRSAQFFQSNEHVQHSRRRTVSSSDINRVMPTEFRNMACAASTKTSSGSDLSDYRSNSSLYENASPSSITFTREMTLNDVSGITGLAVTQNREIIAVCNRDVVCYILDHKGSIIAQVKKFEDPWDAATMSSTKEKVSYVYVTDGVRGNSDGAIYVFTVSHRGKIGKCKYFVKGNIQPSGITTTGKYILFCDQKAKCVKMYNIKGDFIQRIDPGVGKSFCQPMNISSTDELLFVSDKSYSDGVEKPCLITVDTKGVVTNIKDLLCTSQIALSSYGIIICCDTASSKLLGLNPDLAATMELMGNYDAISSPVAVVFDIGERLWVGHALGIDILKLQYRYSHTYS